jgi:hypothetical protein
VAKGYIGIGPTVLTYCRCCRSEPKSKFLCEACLHVCKAPNGGTPYCPAGHGAMRDMGDKWRPAKRSKRTVPPRLPYQRWPSAGESLLAKILEKA